MTNANAFRSPQLFLSVLFITLLFTCISHAEENISLLRIDRPLASLPVITPQQNSIVPKTIALNHNGDLIIRCGKGIITMAYASPEDETVKHRGVMLASSDQDYPLINGISLRLSLTF